MKDFCLQCGVEVVDGGSWGYCPPCAEEAFIKMHEAEHAMMLMRNKKCDHPLNQKLKEELDRHFINPNFRKEK